MSPEILDVILLLLHYCIVVFKVSSYAPLLKFYGTFFVKSMGIHLNDIIKMLVVDYITYFIVE